MKKVAAWHGMTQTHGFGVNVFRDPEAGEFVAQIRTHSPSLVPESIPGLPSQMREFEDQEELRHEELDQLREVTKQWITARCGKILQFIER